MKRFFFAVLALVALSAPAWAAPVHLQPVYDLFNEFLQDLLLGLAMTVSGWIMYVVHKYVTPILGAKWEAQMRDSLNTALSNGVAIAMSKVEDAEKLHQDVDVKSQISAWAAQYAIDHAPQAVSKFGLDPNQLATKALAYLPPAPTTQDTTGATVPKPAAVEVKPLPPIA